MADAEAASGTVEKDASNACLTPALCSCSSMLRKCPSGSARSLSPDLKLEALA